jgi:hypothetical protein
MENVETHRGFHSQFLTADRSVHVWTPPGYDGRSRYPVLYLHDGQNIFDPETSFIRGQYWQAAESAGALVREGQIAPLLIVAVDNAGEARIDEYTPTYSERISRGGHADRYVQMMTQELMPFVAARYRVRGGPRFTAVGGSSLGGLLTLYIGMRCAETFGASVHARRTGVAANLIAAGLAKRTHPDVLRGSWRRSQRARLGASFPHDVAVLVRPVEPYALSEPSAVADGSFLRSNDPPATAGGSDNARNLTHDKFVSSCPAKTSCNWWN